MRPASSRVSSGKSSSASGSASARRRLPSAIITASRCVRSFGVPISPGWASAKLVTLLGENQDIALLTSFADAHPGEIGTPKDLTHLLAVMIAEGNRLRAEALPLAATLFPEDVREDAGRIELLWRHAA